MQNEIPKEIREEEENNKIKLEFLKGVLKKKDLNIKPIGNFNLRSWHVHFLKIFDLWLGIIYSKINLSSPNFFDKLPKEKIEIGDIILLKKEEQSLFNLLIIDSQEDICLLDESLANGSTISIMKKPVKLTKVSSNSSLKGKVTSLCHKISGTLYLDTFEKEKENLKGRIKLNNDPKVEDIDTKNLIFKDSVLKYTEWIYGIVLPNLDYKNIFEQEKHFNLKKTIENNILTNYMIIMIVLQLILAIFLTSIYYSRIDLFIERNENFSIINNLSKFLLILTAFTPNWIIVFHMIITFLSKYFMEKFYNSINNNYLKINQPKSIGFLTQIDHIVFSLIPLLSDEIYKIKGIIINENFYEIKENKMNQIHPVDISPEKKEFKLNIQKIDSEKSISEESDPNFFTFLDPKENEYQKEENFNLVKKFSIKTENSKSELEIEQSSEKKSIFSIKKIVAAKNVSNFSSKNKNEMNNSDSPALKKISSSDCLANLQPQTNKSTIVKRNSSTESDPEDFSPSLSPSAQSGKSSDIRRGKNSFLNKFDAINEIKSDFIDNFNKGEIDMDEVVKALALCHGSKTRKNKTLNSIFHDNIHKNDEIILNFARKCGCSFEGSLKYNQKTSYKLKNKGKIEYYKIIGINYYTSINRKFSIVLKEKTNISDNGAILYVKGYYDSLKTILNLKECEKESLQELSDSFLELGYIPMIFGKKELNEEETKSYIKLVQAQKSNIIIEDDQIEKIISSFENNISFLTLICFEQKIDKITKKFIENCRTARIKTTLLSNNDRCVCLAAAYRSKIVSPDNEIFFIEGNNIDSILVCLKSLLVKYKKNIQIQKEMNSDNTELKFEFHYSIFIDYETFLIINKSDYLLSHFKFLLNFANGVVGYNFMPYGKTKLIEVIQSMGNNKVASIGYSRNDKINMINSNLSIRFKKNKKQAFIFEDITINNIEILNNLMFKDCFVFEEKSLFVFSNILYLKLIIAWINLFDYLLDMGSLFIVLNYKIIAILFFIGFFYCIYVVHFWKEHKKYDFLLDLPNNYEMNKKKTNKNMQIKYCIISNMVISFIDILILFYLWNSFFVKENLFDFQNALILTIFLFFMINVIKDNTRNLNIQFYVFLSLPIILVYFTLSYYGDNAHRKYELFNFFASLQNILTIILIISIKLMTTYITHNFILFKNTFSKYFKAIIESHDIIQIRKSSGSLKEILSTVLINGFTSLEINEFIRKIFFKKRIDPIVSEIKEIINPSLKKDQIADFETEKNFTLKFLKKSLELSYQNEFRKTKSIFLRFILIIGFICFILFEILIRFSIDNLQIGISIFMILEIFVIWIISKTNYYKIYFLAINRIILILTLLIHSHIILLNQMEMGHQLIIYYFSLLIMIWFSFITYSIESLIGFNLSIIILLALNLLKNGYNLNQTDLLMKIIEFLLFCLCSLANVLKIYLFEKYKRYEFLERKNLKIENKNVNDLLSILLPSFVKDLIAQGITSLSQQNDGVAIIFCDINDFDKIIVQEGKNIVKILDYLFREFDGFCLENGVQKIETVGKTYMACSGLKSCEMEFDVTETNSIKKLLKVAFEMKRLVRTLTYGNEDKQITLKIGIHRGPVIAGVIGYHKPQFSLIGDTINTTSRICSTAREGKIVVSEESYKQIKNYVEIICKERLVEAKGKGIIKTYEVSKSKGADFNIKKTRRFPYNVISDSMNHSKKNTIRNSKTLNIENNPVKQKRTSKFKELSTNNSNNSIKHPLKFLKFFEKHSNEIEKSLKQKKKLNIKDESYFSPKSSNPIKTLEMSAAILKNLGIGKKEIYSAKFEKTDKNQRNTALADSEPLTSLFEREKPKNTTVFSPNLSPIQSGLLKERRNSNIITKNISSNLNKFYLSTVLDHHEEKIEKASTYLEVPLPNMNLNIREEEEIILEDTKQLNTSTQQHNDLIVRLDSSYYEFTNSLEEEEYEIFEGFPDDENAQNKSNINNAKSSWDYDDYDKAFKEEFEIDEKTKALKKLTNEKDLLVCSKFLLEFKNCKDETIEEFYSDLFFLYKKQNSLVVSFIGLLYLLDFLMFNCLNENIFENFFGWLRIFNLLSFLMISVSWRSLFTQKWLKIILMSKVIFFTFLIAMDGDKYHYIKEIKLLIAVSLFQNMSIMTFKDSLYLSLSSLFIYLIFSEFRIFQFLLLIGLISIFLFISHQIFQIKISKFNLNSTRMLKKIQQNNLVLNLLPSHILKQFMIDPSKKSELNEELKNVTMLFADIKGYTAYSDQHSPEVVVTMLRDLFVEFDKLCLVNNVYKLYTIGDCYVGLGLIDANDRLPVEEEVKNVINFAFALIDTIFSVRTKISYNELNMRIGIHIGDIIGGIIGTDIVRYDIYGRDVLIANKMESNGLEGHVNVSEKIKNILDNSFPGLYQFEENKIVQIPALDTEVKSYIVIQSS